MSRFTWEGAYKIIWVQNRSCGRPICVAIITGSTIGQWPSIGEPQWISKGGTRRYNPDGCNYKGLPLYPDNAPQCH